MAKLKRSGKWYRKNEQDVMFSLGLTPTPNSGSGWVIKEDGQSENIICQLKSTDKESISVKKLDLDKLTNNASTTHKVPMFAIQFISSGEVYLIVKPENIIEVANHISGIAPEARGGVLDVLIERDDKNTIPQKQMISGASKSRERFHLEKAKKYDKTKKAN